LKRSNGKSGFSDTRIQNYKVRKKRALRYSIEDVSNLTLPTKPFPMLEKKSKNVIKSGHHISDQTGFHQPEICTEKFVRKRLG